MYVFFIFSNSGKDGNKDDNSDDDEDDAQAKKLKGQLNSE